MTAPLRCDTLLVIAPHPDDDVLGCGGTMARLAEQGCAVHVAIVTRGQPPHFDPASVATVQAETARAHAILGVHATHHLDFPAAALDRVTHRDVNRALGDLVARINPDMLFVPFVGDIHLDHQIAFRSALVAARPRAAAYPSNIYAYETLSETNWNAPYLAPGFHPTTFFDIASTLDRKLEAFAAFASQVRAFPDERSVKTLRALATLRGSTVHRVAAEAFVLIREVC